MICAGSGQQEVCHGKGTFRRRSTIDQPSSLTSTGFPNTTLFPYVTSRRPLRAASRKVRTWTPSSVASGKEGLGYEFACYSETSPYAAPGRVRDKMRRGLATRHLSGAKGPAEMLHDALDGRISSRDGEVVVVVDGTALDIDDLARILAAREGWGFKLRITDPLE